MPVYHTPERITICDEDEIHDLRAIDMDTKLSKKSCHAPIIAKESGSYTRFYIPREYKPDFDPVGKFLICKDEIEFDTEVIKSRNKTIGGDDAYSIKVDN